MSKLQSIAEKGFVIFGLLLFTEAVLPVLNEVNGLGASASTPLVRVSYYGVQTVTILLSVVWYKRLLRIATREKLLWILMGLVLLSIFWSNMPSVTLSKIQTIVRSTLFGVYFSVRYSLKEQMRLLAWTFGIAALLSLVFALALPQYGVMGMGNYMSAQEAAHVGAWRGIYTHKNPFGRIMTLSALVFLLLAYSNRKYSWLTGAGFALSVGLIVLSTSKTSLLVLLIIVSLLPFYRALRWNYSLAVPFFITFILVFGSVVILFLSNAEEILNAMGRDVTLTGRTSLWEVVLDKIWERPWLGYGYGVFWRGWDGESADVWRAVKWQTPHAHNGLLDLWLDLGLLGVLVFLLGFIAVCLRAVRWVRLDKTAEGLWPLAYLTFLFLANITESSIMRQNSLWLLYVVITLSTHNRSENLTEHNASYQQQVNKGAVKPIKHADASQICKDTVQASL